MLNGRMLNMPSKYRWGGIDQASDVKSIRNVSPTLALKILG